MTVECWALIAIVTIISVGVSAFLTINGENKGKTWCVAIAVVLVTVLGCIVYMNTATGRRALIDQKSEFNNGINRTITVYTANGEPMAQYSGKIDIAANDGGYVKFDFDGKRYIYYNCFIETVADIE